MVIRLFASAYNTPASGRRPHTVSDDLIAPIDPVFTMNMVLEHSPSCDQALSPKILFDNSLRQWGKPVRSGDERYDPTRHSGKLRDQWHVFQYKNSITTCTSLHTSPVMRPVV